MDNTNLSKFKELHEKYASGNHPELFLDLVWIHSDIVRKIALKFVDNLSAKNIHVNIELVETGALLHDIGMYQAYDDELNTESKNLPLLHGHLGALILKDEGFSEEVQRFCLVHTATGLTKEDIEREKLPVEPVDLVPITLEEEIVTYADKFHTKHPAFDSYEVIANRIGKFDPSRVVKLDTFRRKFGIPDNTDLIEEYREWSRDISAKIAATSTNS